ncbi:MAG: hypothetical protein U9Q82_10225 [Chloroflexota bacterium]|nr:hypothetical protein [Chloroflexota bacterium]
MKKRIGIFFLIVGIFFLIIFAASVESGETSILLFLLGVVQTWLGGFLWWRNRDEKPESQYFRLIRKLRSKEDDGE